jgi:hypothetical protein
MAQHANVVSAGTSHLESGSAGTATIFGATARAQQIKENKKKKNTSLGSARAQGTAHHLVALAQHDHLELGSAGTAPSVGKRTAQAQRHKAACQRTEQRHVREKLKYTKQSEPQA